MRGCLAGLLLATLVVAASGCGTAPEREPGGLDPQSFDAFPLYAPGGDFADSLEVVRQRRGYVEFRYSSEPPLRVEVWPGCVRTPVLRPGMLVEGEAYEGTFHARGATAYEFENGFASRCRSTGRPSSCARRPDAMRAAPSGRCEG